MYIGHSGRTQTPLADSSSVSNPCDVKILRPLLLDVGAGEGGGPERLLGLVHGAAARHRDDECRLVCCRGACCNAEARIPAPAERYRGELVSLQISPASHCSKCHALLVAMHGLYGRPSLSTNAMQCMGMHGLTCECLHWGTGSRAPHIGRQSRRFAT